MVKVREDLTGIVFGELTVLYQDDDYIMSTGKHYATWRCICSCGNEITVQQGHLKSNHTTSCGHNIHKENIYDLSGEYGIGWTTNTNKEFYFDLEDYDIISKYTWYEHKPCDNYRSLMSYDKVKKEKVKFWWIVLGKNCDHIDHNTFNNRKSNLRICSQNKNLQNTGLRSDNSSGVIGVSFNKNTNKWFAYINCDKKRVFTSKLFLNKDDAIKARLEAEVKYFGEFAPQKHLFEKYGIKYEGCDENES